MAVHIEPSSIGTRLRRERERLKLTQAEFGERSQLGRLSIFRYEAGDRFPDADHLARWEKIGVDIYYVLTGVKVSEKIDIDAMEKAVKYILELIRDIGGTHDAKIITKALMQTYLANLQSVEQPSDVKIAKID